MPSKSAQRYLEFGTGRLELGERSHLVGIVNVTPDSFFDGSRCVETARAVERTLRLFADGAEVVDIGGESTRPGFAPVSAEEEIARVRPVIEAAIDALPEALISIDTSKAAVAAAALEAGARIVNDIWGFLLDPEIAEVAAERGASVILMRNGRDGEAVGPILDRVRRSWERSLDVALSAGVAPNRIALDPGIGFGTTREEDLEILANLSAMVDFGYPLLLGTSRKRVTAGPEELPVNLRLEATLATTAAGIAAGVDFFRVHDVAEHRRFVAMADRLLRNSWALG